MAASSHHDVVSAEEHEISCPICLDEFEEPKCLPSCAHNVCQQCLEGMVKKTQKVIECPVCRVESAIPESGVAGFPKNHLLVRLIERTPGRKEKEAIKRAMKKCSEKLEGTKTALQAMEDRYTAAREKAEETKRRIQSLAENVVTLVKEQEKTMLSQIDQKMSENRNKGTFDMHKSTASDLCEKASCCVQTIEDILQNVDVEDLRDLKDALIEELNEFSESLESRTFWASCEFTEPFEVSLTNTSLAEKFVRECSFGSLTFNTAFSDSGGGAATTAPACNAVSAMSFASCGSVICTIDSIKSYEPFSVGVSKTSGHFAVLDEKTKLIHLFNEEGQFLRRFRIMYGDLKDIAVSTENEILVLNRESNRLLHYDFYGNFIKKFITTPKENVKFTSLSVDLHGRVVICSSPCYSESEEDTVSCVLLYNSSGKFMASFGQGRLSSAEKAVFVGGKFFVVDSCSKSVLVFAKNGGFHTEIAKGIFQGPSSIAADSAGNIVVSDRETKAVYVLSQEGSLLHEFKTEDMPRQIAFTKDSKNLLVCFETDNDMKYLQMLTYLT